MRNSVLHNGQMAAYLKKKFGKAVDLKDRVGLKGHLTIFENGKMIFDDHNMITDEGRGYVLDYLGQLGFSETYTISPFGAIVLTKNTATEALTDTFANSVYGGTDYLSDEGVLHIPAWTSVTHVEGDLSLILNGTITQAYGNDPANNHINSVCVVAGVSLTTGGPGEAAYVATANERLFARKHVGDLVKTISNSYSFNWQFSIQ